MTRYTLHVPEQDNQGAPVDPAYFADFIEQHILAAAGGFTLTHGIGAWRGEDVTYREPVRLYWVDSDDSAAGHALGLLAQIIATDLDQEAVYVTAQPLDVRLVTPARVEA